MKQTIFSTKQKQYILGTITKSAKILNLNIDERNSVYLSFWEMISKYRLWKH